MEIKSEINVSTLPANKPSLREMVLDGDKYFQALVADIENAKDSIDIETYIYSNDYFGEKLAEALSQAVARNVTVKVLVDGIGTPFFHACLKKLELAGAEVRVFHPIPFHLSQYKRANSQSFSLTKLFYLLAKINIRNHRKMCIIDKNIVYVGSVNIDQRHLSQTIGGSNWHDMVIQLKNVDIKDLQFAFNIAWNGLPIEEKLKKRFQKINLNPIFRLNYTRHLRRTLYKSILKKIATAKERIWMTSAYFNPNYFILKYLMRAAKRGIDVRIILPDKSDIPIMKIVAATFYTKLLKAGVRIYEYQPSVLHVKSLNIDDWYSIGSSNFNQRSLRHDLEVDVCIQNESTKQILEQRYLEDIANSRQITLADIKEQTWYVKLFAVILLFGKYFL